MLANDGVRGLEVAVAGQEPVDEPDEAVAELQAAGRIVERLHLDQQLVDDTAGALGDAGAFDGGGRHVGAGGAVHAAAGHADGIELLDESDGAALFPGDLAEPPEVGADLAGGGAVPHALEGGGGDEQERNAGLAGHGLGGVGLAGAGGTLEEDAAAGLAAHVVAELLVVEEDLEGVLHLAEHRAEALDVVEADVDLLGEVDGLGGLARCRASGR